MIYRKGLEVDQFVLYAWEAVF